MQGFWSWQIKTRDGQMIADSGQIYLSKEACLRSLDLAKHSLVTILLFALQDISPENFFYES
jgi:uncharacterized protein YegP (UPF0339 family)